jgi:hypothetical protein
MDPVQVQERQVVTSTTVPASTTPYATTAPVAGYSAVGTSQATTVVPLGYRVSQAIWLVVGIMDVILALDFVFRLAKANATGFVNFIYNLAGPLAAPFDGIFGVTITNHSYVSRWGDIVAIVIYSLIAAALTALVRIIATPRATA